MTKHISTIIVDDQQTCITSLCNDLVAYPEIQIVETLTSSEKAKKVIIKQQPNLLFLDVEMPKMNGIELLQEICGSVHAEICVVFYSAFEKYMIDALRASAFDYLLKPYQPEELSLIIDRVKNKFEKQQVNFEQSIRQLLAEDRKFAIHTLTGLLLLKRSEILYFHYKTDSRCWQMTLTDLSNYKLRMNTTAKELLKLSNYFVQINPECILNLDYLLSVENKTFRCVLQPPFRELELFASRRCYTKIKEMLEII